MPYNLANAMPAYMIIEIEVLDAATYAEYMEKVPATVANYGGRYVVRTGNVVPLSGGWRPDRLIIVEFPGAEMMRAWITSADYQSLAPSRERATKTRAIAVQRYEP